ncbi:MAG TPA: cytochrome c oxidase assembly protein, partial [Streptosporangiaceae bacterium]|nr:cytochrome c oxidase assembly protein [Streptosporangiaceae bacterium]
MGSDVLPPFGFSEALGRWQWAPVVTVAVALVAAAYLWGVVRVARRHPARPWPRWRTGVFLGGLFIIVLATQSGIGSYDDVLFWDHMIQHLLLIMVAPALLVGGRPVTLLMHASRNPVHTWVKRVVRSRVASGLTFPAFGIAAYAATIVGTHLTGFMNLVLTNETVHNAEHALYLVVGYLYLLPLIGSEPIRWRLSYPVRLIFLFIAMPVDAFTGVALGSYSTDPFPVTSGMRDRTWGPSPVDDVHIGGAVMWVGGSAIMFVLIMFVFLGWTRQGERGDSRGWLETARRASLEQLTTAGAPP